MKIGLSAAAAVRFAPILELYVSVAQQDTAEAEIKPLFTFINTDISLVRNS